MNMVYLCEICTNKINSLYLHRVFHSIRFKVNKDWSTAVLLFYVLPLVSWVGCLKFHSGLFYKRFQAFCK
jgi:hypothetical protein